MNKPITPTPPAPTDDEVREAREVLESHLRKIKSSAGNHPFLYSCEVHYVETILAALDKAQGEVADLRPEYHYAEPSDTKWAKATSLLCNYIREHAHDPYRKALLEAVDALLETAEKNAHHNTRLLVCFDHMRKQKLALCAANAELLELWENQKNTICLGPVCPLHTTAAVALERLEDANFKIASQAEQIKRLRGELTEISVLPPTDWAGGYPYALKLAKEALKEVSHD